MDIDFLCVRVYVVLLKAIYYREFEGMVAAVICAVRDFALAHLHNDAECGSVCVCGRWWWGGAET